MSFEPPSDRAPPSPEPSPRATPSDDGRGHEDRLVPAATEADLDPDAVERYLDKLLDLYPSSELRDATSIEIVQSVGGARRAGGRLVPTVAGVLLFGRRASLARLFPAHRVDYLLGDEAGGTTRATTREIHEPLPAAFRRVYQAILDDLARASEPRRDCRALPKHVLREALVNAIVHRDYGAPAPVEVIRFADRLEIRSPGVALVGDDELGAPGSLRRNPRIAEVFRDLGLAESKGVGIRAMRRALERAERPPPQLASEPRAGQFIATIPL
jgi:ATP-dependent DNA helicase RecG